MRITPHIHALNLPFTVPAPTGPIDRSVNVFLICAETVTLVDSGVAGAEDRVFSYLNSIGRKPGEIELLLLTHSHPDHVGGAQAIKAATGCRVAAHEGETDWIEDTERQGRERPVPGFDILVGGPVAVDRKLVDGDTIALGDGITVEIMHTPGHSPGSLSLWCPSDCVLITGDAVPLPGDMPIFDSHAMSVSSLERLRGVPAKWLLSSWDTPKRGDCVCRCIDDSLAWLERVRETARNAARGEAAPDPMAHCRQAAAALGLPPFAINPLVARSFLACLDRKIP